MKRTSLPLLLTPLVLASPSALADLSLYQNEHGELEAYGKLKAVLHYQQHRNPASNFEDDSSRVGLKGNYQILDDAALFGLVEVGSHFNKDNQDDLFTLRLAYAGVDSDYGQVAWGKQEALIHNLDNYDLSNKLGGVAHYTRDEMNNKRNESTLSYRLDWNEFRFEAQANGRRDLDRSVRLRSGGESFKVNEDQIDNGLGFGVRYKYQPQDIQIRVASQLTHYQHGAEAFSIATTVVKKGQFASERDWRLGATSGYYMLEDERDSASAYTFGLSGKMQLWQQVSGYMVAETIQGRGAIDAGREKALTAGVEYNLTSAAKLYTEAQQSWFDSNKEDQRQLVLGGIYKF